MNNEFSKHKHRNIVFFAHSLFHTESTHCTCVLNLFPVENLLAIAIVDRSSSLANVSKLSPAISTAKLNSVDISFCCGFFEVTREQCRMQRRWEARGEEGGGGR